MQLPDSEVTVRISYFFYRFFVTSVYRLKSKSVDRPAFRPTRLSKNAAAASPPPQTARESPGFPGERGLLKTEETCGYLIADCKSTMKIAYYPPPGFAGLIRLRTSASSLAMQGFSAKWRLWAVLGVGDQCFPGAPGLRVERFVGPAFPELNAAPDIKAPGRLQAW